MIATGVESASLMPIAVELIRCGEKFDFDLFLRDGGAGKPVLYRGKTFPIQQTDLQALQRRGIRTLFIAAEALVDYERYLHEQVLNDASATPDARFCAVREANRSVFLTAMQDKNVGSIVQVASDLALKLADAVCSHDRTVDQLFHLLSHDYYTYTHVTNVCVYTLALAKSLGISNQQELAVIAIGGLLHDLGKRQVPVDILHKKARLTRQEMAVVKRHPITGLQELCRRKDLSWDQLMMVYQHHERLDGRGYPANVTAEEILPWSRMCAIADVFDALTSSRPYRGPMAREDVRQFFCTNAGTAFDKEMVHCWNIALKAGD